MESIGEKILKLRTKADITQEALAEVVEVTRQTVSKWERNVAQPTPQNFKTLCEYFGVELNYFLSDEEVLLIKSKIKETVSLPEENNESPAVNELAVTETATETVTEKEPKFKMLKIISIVVATVLLVLFITGCGIAIYVTSKSEMGGAWSDTSHSIDYVGIIFIVLGVVVIAISITLMIMLILKVIKRKKDRKNK